MASGAFFFYEREVAIQTYGKGLVGIILAKMPDLRTHYLR